MSKKCLLLPLHHVTFVLVGMLIVCTTPVSPTFTAEKGWIELFNGRDLSGWEVVAGEKEAWRVVDGGIERCREGGGWLKSDEEYDDFILSLEYKISKEGNSGIFVRAARTGNPAFTGMELQILDDYGKRPGAHSTGSIYAAVAPSKNMSRPAGECNQIIIGCLGRNVYIVMNGQDIADINVDEYNKPLKRAFPRESAPPKR